MSAFTAGFPTRDVITGRCRAYGVIRAPVRARAAPSFLIFPPAPRASSSYAFASASIFVSTSAASATTFFASQSSGVVVASVVASVAARVIVIVVVPSRPDVST